jgi:thiol:disulfide interchange protein DsbD
MKNFLLALGMLLSLGIAAQPQNPVTWTATYKPVSAILGEVIVTAKIDKGWHTYSQRPTDAGPIPTSFTFTPSNEYSLVGKTTESDAHEEFVKAFEAKIFVFKDKAEFRQKVSVKAGTKPSIALKVEYMSCNDMMCLPPKVVDLTVKTQ